MDEFSEMRLRAMASDLALFVRDLETAEDQARALNYVVSCAFRGIGPDRTGKVAVLMTAQADCMGGAANN